MIFDHKVFIGVKKMGVQDGISRLFHLNPSWFDDFQVILAGLPKDEG